MISVPFPRAWNLIFNIPNNKLACHPGKPYTQFGNSLMISQGFVLRQFQALALHPASATGFNWKEAEEATIRRQCLTENRKEQVSASLTPECVHPLY